MVQWHYVVVVVCGSMWCVVCGLWWRVALKLAFKIWEGDEIQYRFPKDLEDVIKTIFMNKLITLIAYSVRRKNYPLCINL